MKALPLNNDRLRSQIRIRLSLFIVGLVVSGLSALPIESLLQWAYSWRLGPSSFADWIRRIYLGVHKTNMYYPFMAYGTDWLAFGHFVIAIAFIGPLKDPVRNIWIVEFGIISCLAIFPFAFVAGHVRSIPMFWRLIDCSFGLVGALLLLNCYLKIKSLIIKQPQNESSNQNGSVDSSL
jgi:hypothetical protein